MTATDSRGPFEVRGDCGMVAFGVAVPRRLTIIEALRLSTDLYATVVRLATADDAEAHTALQDLHDSTTGRAATKPNERGAHHGR